MNKKKLFRWIKIGVLIYCLAGIALYYCQDSLLWHPKTASLNDPFPYGQAFAEVNLNYDKQTQLNVIQFRAGDRPDGTPAKNLVLFFPDGADNAATNGVFAASLTARGSEVWTMDYPGFGKSTGSRKESNLYAYALVFYKLARSRWQPEQIVIRGKGVGAAIATELASVRDCQRLIIEDAFYSLDAAWRPYFFLYPLGSMLHSHFPVYRYLPDVTAPVTMIRSAGRLKQFLKPGDEFTP